VGSSHTHTHTHTYIYIYIYCINHFYMNIFEFWNESSEFPLFLMWEIRFDIRVIWINQGRTVY
jgi:hypothetical protein